MHTDTKSLAVESELFAIQATKMASKIFEELGTSCGGTATGDDVFPSGGEEPYETIDDVRQVMILGTQLSRVCWGSNAMNNRKYYIADTGHVVTVKPRQQDGSLSSDSVKSDAVRRVEKFLEDWMKETGWKLRQAEVSNRLDQHGEVFDLLHYGQDGILRPYFAEPTDLDDDPKSIFQDADPEDSERQYVDLLGVRRTNDIRYVPTDYFINDQWFPDLLRVSTMGRIPDSEKLQERTAVQHRKRNVLGNDPRGLTLYWPVREEMVFAKKLLANLMRVSAFQAAFGAIRTINASQGADAVRSWMNSQQTGAGNSGESEKFDFPSAAVVTVPQSVSYDFPETGAGNSNQIEVLVSLLRACAAGMKLPEFMLTANVSEGNFASTLVSEGPFHKGMRFEQFQMVTEDERILWQALRYAARSGEYDINSARGMPGWPCSTHSSNRSF